MSKSIFTSKTFWLNVIGIAVPYAGLLDPDVAGIVLAGLNIVNRFLTDRPVHLVR